jgi:2-polyprenyl-3-methyl-5-hydroxy-6-metoxy-1,4-benzoquinol methylase
MPAMSRLSPNFPLLREPSIGASESKRLAELAAGARPSCQTTKEQLPPDMRPDLSDLFECPQCQGDFFVVGALNRDTEIIAGTLECRSCAFQVPVEDGIPRFVPRRSYADSFGLQWNRWRSEQLDSANDFSLSSDRLFSETGWSPEWLKGKLILDAGCGAGRFVDVASSAGARVVGVDLSSAIDATRRSLGPRPNVDLVQASILDMPFKAGIFDGAYCIGVVQHTPRPEETIRQVISRVRPEGLVAFTIYERRRWTRLYSKYWLRPFTTRLSPRALLTLVSVLMPVLFILSEITFRIPGVGKIARFVIPVANYVGANEHRSPGLSIHTRYTWAVMDTFDMFAPAYDHPMTENEVRGVLREAGVDGIERHSSSALSLGGSRSN